MRPHPQAGDRRVAGALIVAVAPSTDACRPGREGPPLAPVAPRRKLPHLALLAAVVGLGRQAAAQDDPAPAALDELRARLAAQELEMAGLRARLDAREGAEGGAPSLDDFLGGGDDGREPEYGSRATVVSVHGFMHFRYSEREDTDPTFDLHHANLFFGADIGDYAQAWVELEYEHAGEEIELDQAEMRFFLGEVTLAAGRFYAPFGIERRTWYSTERHTESRPDAFRYVVPGNWYETGVRLDTTREVGDWRLRAELGLTNGLDADADTDVRASRQTRDNNGSKALIGRLGLAPSGQLDLGLSGATMAYDGDDTIDFLGVDAEYVRGPWLLRAEAVRSMVADPAGPVGDFEREGLYLLASRELLEDGDEEHGLRLSGRYDLLDGNDRVVDDQDFSAWTLTLAWRPRPHVVLRGEVRAFDGRHGADPPSDHELSFGVALGF